MILAIYSKGRFDKEAGGLGVGDVFGIDRYGSKHKGLTPLAQGGALFVVTARPGDVLWLVAVLEAPTFDGDGWVAARNTAPICDITDRVGKIRFTSGKGIKAGAGKLGMSLQTPRALSEDDIVLLREAAGSAAPTKARKKAGKKKSAAAKRQASKPAKEQAAEQADPSLERVAKHLGKEWRVDGTHLLHAKSGASFAYVPGGWLRMGFSLDDLYDACRARKRRPFGEDSDWPGEIAKSRPPHMVAVTPFVIAVTKHDRSDKRFGKGFRLPSEAELEWVFRRGGQDRWVGVPGDKLFRPNTRWKLMADPDPPFGLELETNADHEYCADDWHEDYQGAPATSAPWGAGCQVYRSLHTNWQDDDEEMISVHAAYRMGASSSPPRFRPTLSLPKLRQDRPGKDRPDAVEADQLMAALSSRDKGEIKAAWWALELLVEAPAPDVRVPFEHVIANLPRDAKSLRQALTWLGLLTMGPRPDKADPHAKLRASLRAALPKPGTSRAYKQLQALLAHEDKKVRAAAVTVVTAASLATGQGAALAKRLPDEPDKVVAAAMVIGLGLLGQTAPASDDRKIERALKKVRVLADGLRGKAKPLDIAAALDVTGMGKLPWFDGELDEMGKDLLRALPKKERDRVAITLAEQGTVMFDLVFEEFACKPDKDPQRRLRKLTLLRLDELTAVQRQLVEAAEPPSVYSRRNRFRLPSSKLGHEILLGRSESTWTRLVDTPRGLVPAFFALMDARAQAAADEVDEEIYERQVRELFSDWSLDDMLKLEYERRYDGEDLDSLWGVAGRDHHCHVAWPYEYDRVRLRLIREAPTQRRRALRKTLLTRLRSHLKALPQEAEERWPKTLSPADLAASLEPGEVFPGDALAGLELHSIGAVCDFKEPLDLAEPEFGAWLRLHMERHILRSIAGKETLESRCWIPFYYIVSPRWVSSSVLTILAYEMGVPPSARLYDHIKDDPSLAAQWDAIPEMVHQRNDDGCHPKPRAAVKVLWEAAQAARS